jgi:hypothetical protein
VDDRLGPLAQNDVTATHPDRFAPGQPEGGTTLCPRDG